MKEFIENHITWEKLAPHEEGGEFLLSVEHASVIRETQKLNIDIALNFIVPHDDLKVVTAAFCREFQRSCGCILPFFGTMIRCSARKN